MQELVVDIRVMMILMMMLTIMLDEYDDDVVDADVWWI